MPSHGAVNVPLCGEPPVLRGLLTAAADRGVGVLLISSELDELLSVAHRVVVLYRGRVMGICRADRSERERIGAWMAGQQEQTA